jgi:hypothetical protein
MFIKKEEKLYETKTPWVIPLLIDLANGSSNYEDVVLDQPVIYHKIKIENANGDDGKIAYTDLSFANPIEKNAPTHGWFDVEIGKMIEFSSPIIVDAYDTFRHWKGSGSSGSDAIVNIEGARLEILEDYYDDVVNSMDIAWTDEKLFHINDEMMPLHFEGSLVREIKLNASNTSEKYYIPPIFDYFSIDAISVHQKTNSRQNDATSIFVTASNSKITKKQTIGYRWNGNYNPTNSNVELNISPVDFYGNTFGGSREYGGIFGASTNDNGSPNPNFYTSYRNFNQTFIPSPIQAGTNIIIEAKNTENLSDSSEINCDVQLELSFYKKLQV